MTALRKLREDSIGVFMSEDNKSSWLQTGTGRRVCVLNPRPEEIYVKDIAMALAKQCRFNGMCKSFYSVAQHCVMGSELAEKLYGKEAAKEFLMHDATEAYVGDLIRPVKVMIPAFRKVEEGFWKAISTKFSLPFKHSDECKYIDEVMVTWEKRDLLPNSEEWPRLPDISKMELETLLSWEWEIAEHFWLKRYEELFLKDN